MDCPLDLPCNAVLDDAADGTDMRVDAHRFPTGTCREGVCGKVLAFLAIPHLYLALRTDRCTPILHGRNALPMCTTRSCVCRLCSKRVPSLSTRASLHTASASHHTSSSPSSLPTSCPSGRRPWACRRARRRPVYNAAVCGSGHLQAEELNARPASTQLVGMAAGPPDTVGMACGVLLGAAQAGSW